MKKLLIVGGILVCMGIGGYYALETSVSQETQHTTIIPESHKVIPHNNIEEGDSDELKRVKGILNEIATYTRFRYDYLALKETNIKQMDPVTFEKQQKQKLEEVYKGLEQYYDDAKLEEFKRIMDYYSFVDTAQVTMIKKQREYDYLYGETDEEGIRKIKESQAELINLKEQFETYPNVPEEFKEVHEDVKQALQACIDILGLYANALENNYTSLSHSFGTKERDEWLESEHFNEIFIKYFSYEKHYKNIVEKQNGAVLAALLEVDPTLDDL